MSNIRKKVIGGVAWTYAERMLAQVISLIVTVILARILSPREYGIIAIVSIFISFADTFAINGFGNALIQKKDADHLDFSSVFYFNIVFSIGIYLILWIISPYISDFYEIGELTLAIRIMAIRIPIAAINSVQQAYVSKRMEFKKFFFATLGGTLISAIVGITMAYCGCGVWSLVAQHLTNTCIDTLVLWITIGWRPQKEYSWQRVKGLINYGWKILASSLMINIYGNLTGLIIGKKYSSEDLAYSTKGAQFPGLISVNINTSLTKVLFPALANQQENIESVKSITRRAICVGSYLLSPLLLGFAAISPSFIHIILTDKWAPAIPFVALYCVIEMFQPIQSASIQAMKAVGESGIYLRLEIWKKLFGLCVLGITAFMFNSVIVIVIGSLVCEIFSSILNFPTNKKLLSYSYKEQLKDFIIATGPSVIMALCVALIGLFFHSYIIRILIQMVSGGLIYLLFSHITKNPNYLYILETIKAHQKRDHK